MLGTQFDRDALARFYALRHMKTDPGVRAVHYLPAGAPDREIRLVEVNELIAQRVADPLEPLDFGVSLNGEGEPHTLLVVDVTPSQWDQVERGDLWLPAGWSLEGAIHFSR